MREFISVAIAVTVLTACQPATNDLTEDMRTEIASEVNDVHSEFWDTWRETDFERGMQYYLNSPEFTFSYQGKMITGYSEFHEFFATAFANVASQTVSSNDLQTVVVGRDAVFITTQGAYSVTDTEGVTGPESDFAFTTLWVRRDGDWKIQLAVNSEPTVWTP